MKETIKLFSVLMNKMTHLAVESFSFEQEEEGVRRHLVVRHTLEETPIVVLKCNKCKKSRFTKKKYLM